ncbi:hypothetical protein CBR_g54341 [Chara braunii]|uniref:Uncharacterized protein n=1 Tax=Chara braunii TaxID=69332 RepID=A0A388MBZ4_CHABU|nr:hypothetical protein CBR_g54341 [Chara braunii]|eukprot:GBG92086.1 hypothetical protein CBR_g54341 [Chara braunii]
MAAAHRLIWTSGQMVEVSGGAIACSLSALCARGGVSSLSMTRANHVECDLERIHVEAPPAHTSPDIVSPASSHLRDSHAGRSTPRGHLLLSHLAAATDNPSQLGGQAQLTCSRVHHAAATSAPPPPPPSLTPTRTTTLPSTSPSLPPARRVNPMSFSAFPMAITSSRDVTCQGYGGDPMNRSRATWRAWAAAARGPMSSPRRDLRSLTLSPADRRRLSTSRHVEEEQRVDQAMAAAREEIDDINQKFAEAREEIELALESKDTIYFNEEAESARKACNEAISAYQGLLSRLGENARGALQRSMGLKMEQLKAELEQLKESDH